MKLNYKKGNLITLGLIGILGIMAIVNIPQDIETIKYLINDYEWGNELLYEIIKPQRLILELCFDLLKISLLFFGALIIRQRKLNSRFTFIIMLIFLLVFLYFDLPIHRCYNGNLETYWELGRHFH